MTEQHYGTAPCGCWKVPAGPEAESYGSEPGAWAGGRCDEHLCDNDVMLWDAASALEQGLRAIAGWRRRIPWIPTTEPSGEGDPAYMFRESDLRKMTEWPGVSPAALDWLRAMIDPQPAVRTSCYYCGATKPLPCSDHPEQPPP